MTSVNLNLGAGAQTYTWDNNGNLLNDGVNTYTYDAANRLQSVTGGDNASAYSYSGLGDRLSQTYNGVTTNYALDLNAGLTQVLSDGTNTYLYGPSASSGQIGELQPGGFAYHLGDALGSVRQLTGARGAVTLATDFQPFGTALTTSRAGATSFGFTGQQTDLYTELQNLRSRWYRPATGTFLTKDSYQNYNSPQSLNGFNYVEGNPINRTDPTGMMSQAQIARGFGYQPTEFSKVVDWFSAHAPNDFALLAALQDARNNYTLGVGVDDALAYEWVVSSAGDQPFLLDYKSGGRSFSSLRDFADFISKTHTHDLPLGSHLNDYFDKINMYYVNGAGRGGEPAYKAFDQLHDGWLRMPDVRVLAFAPNINVKLGVGGGVQTTIDRYGYIRGGGDIGLGAGVNLAGAASGWVTHNGDSSILNENDLGKALEGGSLGVSANVIYTRGESGSFSNLFGYKVWWEGLTAGVMVSACSLSVTTGSIAYQPELSWDWVDRLRPYSIQDIQR